MPVRFDPKIKTIMSTLHSRKFALKGIKNGIRLKLNKGIDVDIYTLKSRPEHIRARLKIGVADDIERELAIDAVVEQMREGLADTAQVDEFRFSREADGLFHYYARITMAEAEAEIPTLNLEMDQEPVGWTEQEQPGDEPKTAEPEAETEIPTLVLEMDDDPINQPEPGRRAYEPEAAEPEVEDEIPTLVFEMDDDPVEWAGPVQPLHDPEATGPEAEKEGILRSAVLDAAGTDLERAVELLESVDAKTFRKALDGLGLARSSILRVALTRLFRSAISAEELKEAAKEEAQRITDPIDQVELQKIQQDNTIEYLQPLIDALLDDDIDALELE